MSVERVTLDWLETDSGLTRPETKSLLSALEKMGALEITSLDGVPAVPADRSRRRPAPSASSPQRHGFLRAGLALMAARGDGAFQAVRNFLDRPLWIEPRGLRAEIVLDRTMPHISPVNEGLAVTASLSAQEVDRLSADLASLLNQHPSARKVLPHLSVFERVLRTKGPIAADLLPESLLRTALRQLRSLGSTRKGTLGLLENKLEAALGQQAA